MSGGRQDHESIHGEWRVLRVTFGLGLSCCRLTLQLDLFCHSPISLLVTKPHLVSPANECLILLGTRNSIHALTAQLCHQVFREY